MTDKETLDWMASAKYGDVYPKDATHDTLIFLLARRIAQLEEKLDVRVA